MRYDVLSTETAAKRFQEEECLNKLRVHNARHARTRGSVKMLSDNFRKVEVNYQRIQARQNQEFVGVAIDWNSFPNRACITHQDDMSKLYLAHFVLLASFDITRWRFDAKAHVSSINNNAVVLSHEQGTGPRIASAFIEEILLDHLLRCRGESVKVIFSKNASVGKNWMTEIALPQ